MMSSRVFHVFVLTLLIISANSVVNSQEPVQDKDAVILEQEYISNENGYTFRYRTSNGIERSEQGTFEEPDRILRVKGQYRYAIGNQVYEVAYKADENGYVAKQAAKKAEQKQGLEGKKQTALIADDFTEKQPEAALPITPKIPSTLRIAGAAIASLAGGGIG